MTQAAKGRSFERYRLSRPSTIAASRTVSPIISSTGFRPTVISSFTWVFTPIAAIDTTRNQFDRETPAAASWPGTQPRLFTMTSPPNTATNHGSMGGRRAACGSVLGARISATVIAITGSSIATRISLTTVAVSPVGVDML